MRKLALLSLAVSIALTVPTLLYAAGLPGVAFKPAGPGEPVVVEKIQNGTPAAIAGLQPGDLILEMDGRSVQGQDPQEILNRIEEKLASNQSAVLVYKRDNWKTAAWICPLRLSPAQQGTLAFAESFRELHDSAGENWGKICESFNGTITGPAEREQFLQNTEEWRKSLRLSGRSGAHMPLPEAVSGDLRKTLQDMTLGLSKEQALRMRALALMEDYLANWDESRQPAAFSELESPYEKINDRQTFGERRWDRMVETVKMARRSELRLQVLFREALDRSGLSDSELIDPVL